MSSKLHRKLETAALSLHFDAGGQEESLRNCRLKRPAGSWCAAGPRRVAGGPKGRGFGGGAGELKALGGRSLLGGGAASSGAAAAQVAAWAAIVRRGERGEARRGAAGASARWRSRRRARCDLQVGRRGARAGAGRDLAAGSAASISGSLLARSFRRRFP